MENIEKKVTAVISTHTTRAIERMIDHYMRNKTIRIEVPEWHDENGKPLVITATRFTVADQEKLERLKNSFESLELLVEILIKWACDENGNRLFTLEDKHALMYRVDSQIIARVVKRICNPPRHEELKKN